MLTGYSSLVRRSPTARGLALGVLALAGLGTRDGRAQQAEENRRRAVTFAEARATAEAHAPEVTLSERRDDIARTQADVAGALANPTVTLLAARQTARLGVGVSVPLPVFGQRATAVDAARSDAVAASLDVEAIRREARFAATLAWLDLWEAQARARLFDEAAADAARLATIADEKFRAGSVPRVDVLRTAADRARARADAASAAAAVPAAAARLALATGMGDGVALEAEGKPGLAASPMTSRASTRRWTTIRRCGAIGPRLPRPPRTSGPSSGCAGRRSTPNWS